MSEINKIKLELSPYTCLSLLSFLREYLNDSNKHIPELSSIHESVDEFQAQVIEKSNIYQIEDGIAESKVNQLLGKAPSE